MSVYARHLQGTKQRTWRITKQRTEIIPNGLLGIADKGFLRMALILRLSVITRYQPLYGLVVQYTCPS